MRYSHIPPSRNDGWERIASTARSQIVLSITGGSGLMSDSDGSGLSNVVHALHSFDGLMLAGLGRIVDERGRICPSVTELLPRLPALMARLGMAPASSSDIISHDEMNRRLTFVHPSQVPCLRFDGDWSSEMTLRASITASLRDRGWDSLLVANNGGELTEREVRLVASHGWPVLLVQGSGRVTDQLAMDTAFLAAHENVTVVQNDPFSLRAALRTSPKGQILRWAA